MELSDMDRAVNANNFAKTPLKNSNFLQSYASK